MTSVEADFLAASAERDWSRAVPMIDEHWSTLLFSRATYERVTATVNGATVGDLLDAPRAGLIAEVVGRLPVGSVRVALPSTSARIEHVLREGNARTVVEVATLGMISRRATGRPAEAVEIARVSRPLLRAAALTRFSPAADLAAYWHLQAGQAALHLGDLAQAARDFQHAWTLRADDVTGYVAPSAAPFLALIASLSGDPEEARRWQAEVDALAPHGRTLIEWDTMERPRLVARLLDATDRLDTGAGAELSDHLLPQLAFDEIWPITLVALVRHQLDSGTAEQAHRLIDTTVDLHPSAPRSAAMHPAYVALARGDVALAQGRTGEVERLLAGGGPGLPRGVADLYAALVDALAGDWEAAKRRAAIAEDRTSLPRVREHSRLLRTAVDGSAVGGPYPPHLRRTASLLPASLNDRLRAAYGDDVPRANAHLPDGPVEAVRLTPGESRVLAALDGPGGLSEVADRLHVSRNTLKSHLRALYGKLGVASREEALARAARLGLLGNDGGPPP